MSSARACRSIIGVFVALLVTGTLSSRMAFAEVSIVKSDTWDLYTSGRVNGFFSYGRGDGNPVPLKAGENIPMGGGLNPGVDGMPGKLGPDGVPLQGTFQSMRVRSGFVPNVFGMGLRKQLTDTTTLNIYLAFWMTIETPSQRKTSPNDLDAREGYAKVEGPWGSILAGRALSLFSRGATENDFLYGHGYSLGYPGNIDNNGPTNGMIGFGVLAAFFSPGIVYATPKKAGLQLNLGIYDPNPLPGGYEATRYVRPETELTYDASSTLLKLHLFANGEVQSVYLGGSNTTVKSYGAGYGGRLEVGAFHLGVAGHYGKGLGLAYALEANAISVSQDFELRTFDGYSAFAQYSASRFDLNLGWGISRAFLLQVDKDAGNLSLLKRQFAYSAAFVFHATSNLHVSIDFLHADALWFLGEKQIMNFINTGMVATW